MLKKIAIVLLLVGIAGLTTAAKDGQYYPAANPARQVSLSTKMNLNHVPVGFRRAPLEKVAQIVVARPRPTMCRPVEPELLLIEGLAITLSEQHRSPPAFV
jgi:hypothetical protein